MSKTNEIERINPARITDNDTGETYELDFNRESVLFAERKEFIVNNVADFPASMIPDLFYYSFRKNHKNLAREKVDKIREKWGGVPTSLVSRLAALYTQAAMSNNIQSDEDAEKNSVVTLELD